MRSLLPLLDVMMREEGGSKFKTMVCKRQNNNLSCKNKYLKDGLTWAKPNWTGPGSPKKTDEKDQVGKYNGRQRHVSSSIRKLWKKAPYFDVTQSYHW